MQNPKPVINVLLKNLSINQDISAIFLGGSHARKIADDQSDIDLYVVWKKAPNFKQRRFLVKNLRSCYKIGLPFDSFFGASDHLLLKPKIDLIHLHENQIQNLQKLILKSVQISAEIILSNINKKHCLYGGLKKYPKPNKIFLKKRATSLSKEIDFTCLNKAIRRGDSYEILFQRLSLSQKFICLAYWKKGEWVSGFKGFSRLNKISKESTLFRILEGL